MLVAAQLLLAGLYLPPLLNTLLPASPPETIISLPVQTAGHSRALGALVILVAVQLSALGLYRPPVFNGWKL
jgi:hypothetical protein